DCDLIAPDRILPFPGEGHALPLGCHLQLAILGELQNGAHREIYRFNNLPDADELVLVGALLFIGVRTAGQAQHETPNYGEPDPSHRNLLAIGQRMGSTLESPRNAGTWFVVSVVVHGSWRNSLSHPRCRLPFARHAQSGPTESGSPTVLP